MDKLDKSDMSGSSDVPVIKSPRQIRRGSAGEWMGKAITRRGGTYQIRGVSSSSDEDEFVNHTDAMLVGLYSDTLRLSSKANTKAARLKYLNIFAVLFTIVAGTVIGILSLESGSDTPTSVSAYIASILGFLITGVHTILSTFPINKRSVLLRADANRLRKISRQLQMLQASNIPTDEKVRRLEAYFAEVDELDLDIFDSGVKSPNDENEQPSKIQSAVNYVRGKSKGGTLPTTMSDVNVLDEMNNV